MIGLTCSDALLCQVGVIVITLIGLEADTCLVLKLSHSQGSENVILGGQFFSSC